MAIRALKKGTLVRVRTTNGGDSLGTLFEDYNPGEGAAISSGYGNDYIVEPLRLKPLEEIHVPTVHLNGTDYDGLLRQQRHILKRCNDLIEALAQATPHGRDYYPQGNHGEPARLQHEAWIQKIEELRRETEARAEAIFRQKER